jgi:hypothetical protein
MQGTGGGRSRLGIGSGRSVGGGAFRHLHGSLDLSSAAVKVSATATAAGVLHLMDVFGILHGPAALGFMGCGFSCLLLLGLGGPDPTRQDKCTHRY